HCNMMGVGGRRINRNGEKAMAEDKFIHTLVAMTPDSPAGRQLRWYLGVLSSQGEAASAADHERYAPQLAKRMGRADTDEEGRRDFRSWAERVGEITDVTIRSASEVDIEASISAAKDRKWRLKMVVEPEPPHRIVQQQFDRELDANVEVRKAVES